MNNLFLLRKVYSHVFPCPYISSSYSPSAILILSFPAVLFSFMPLLMSVTSPLILSVVCPSLLRLCQFFLSYITVSLSKPHPQTLSLSSPLSSNLPLLSFNHQSERQIKTNGALRHAHSGVEGVNISSLLFLFFSHTVQLLKQALKLTNKLCVIGHFTAH